VESVYIEIIADWYSYFAILGVVAFAVFWYLGTSFFGGKLIIMPFFFFVMAMFGFLARKQKAEVIGV